jgi:hypothetical protein
LFKALSFEEAERFQWTVLDARVVIHTDKADPLLRKVDIGGT